MCGPRLRSRRFCGREDAGFFAAHYDVTAGRQFRRPQHPQPAEACAAEHGRTREGSPSYVRMLLSARAKRVRPGLDDKVLADWNGLMIAALVRCRRRCSIKPAWIAMAARAFIFIAAHMTQGDRLGHSWREDKLLFPGLASDHAAMIGAALALHEATGESAVSSSAP